MNLSITVVIIILTAITSFYGINNPAFLERWMFTPYKIKRNQEWDRFVTSGFIHKDYIHLFFNMFTFYFFGGVVEQVLSYKFGSILGGVVFVFFYILAIIISDLPTYFKNKDNSYYRALGASGGTAATVFASIIIMPLSDICLFGILCLPGFILGILFLLYSYFKGKNQDDAINHDAHLFGALFGIFFILAIAPESASSFLNQILSYKPF
ncbi:rhomboid family intramembrane serine protease [Algoriphagus halophytocola]|uniref:Rhomboid family intramembrane serine protease n=1 Tax=Algoriphagus halophytocola TaxID=2991499 RepID=A0ABY6MEH8_9BACT|nr:MULTISPECIES: rhomboid family intramembrane serine protease [unclassified Algoriphagus]UZD22212.1 rhomboid family intramembrane serine protease [Algoriphagus sp. TR-M5]WBL43462.1 rhomboid family intramembrane serine protease [Algoriphagus sp. TR-M9]